MEVGQSLNPLIDIGQIEGAFVQGCGLYTHEAIKYSEEGFLMTRDIGTFKIPTARNIPIQLNVSILKESKNEKAVYSSKVCCPIFYIWMNVMNDKHTN